MEKIHDDLDNSIANVGEDASLIEDLNVNNEFPRVSDEEEKDIVVENIKNVPENTHKAFNSEFEFEESTNDVGDFRKSRIRKREIVNNVTELRITGLRVEESEKEPKIVDGGIISVLRERMFSLRLFGRGFTGNTTMAFTYVPARYGEECRHLIPGEHLVSVENNFSM